MSRSERIVTPTEDVVNRDVAFAAAEARAEEATRERDEANASFYEMRERRDALASRLARAEEALRDAEELIRVPADPARVLVEVRGVIAAALAPGEKEENRG